MRRVVGHPTGDKECSETVRPIPEDGAHVVENVSIGAGHGDGDDGASSAEPGVVEKGSPESEETLEDLRCALAAGRLHGCKSPLAGAVEGSVEKLGLSPGSGGTPIPGCGRDRQDLL